MAHDNTWLVLVFHGVNGIGWEPRTGAELEEYFNYMNEWKAHLWIATFADVTKYIRERKNSVIRSEVRDNTVLINVSSELDPEVYDVPITLKTYVPKAWKTVVIQKRPEQEDQPELKLQNDDLGSFVLYSVKPGDGEIVLAGQLEI
jgi:hypothetical protein